MAFVRVWMRGADVPPSWLRAASGSRLLLPCADDAWLLACRISSVDAVVLLGP
jgi:hypothetical protein